MVQGVSGLGEMVDGLCRLGDDSTGEMFDNLSVPGMVEMEKCLDALCGLGWWWL